MILIFISLLAFQNGDPWEQANQAYRDGQFGEAIQQYESILDGGVRNGKVHYNLANAYFKNGQLGPALLNYYRAERLMPGNKDIEHNLELANEQRNDPVIEDERGGLSTAVEHFFFGLPYQGVFFAAMILLVVAGLASLPLAFGRRHRLWGYAAFIAGLTGIALTLVATYQHQRLTAQDAAVVMAAQVDVLAGPAPGEAVNFTLHEGIRCHILEQQPGWYRVRLANGYNGWLPRTAVEKI